MIWFSLHCHQVRRNIHSYNGWDRNHRRLEKSFRVSANQVETFQNLNLIFILFLVELGKGPWKTNGFFFFFQFQSQNKYSI